MDPLTAMVIAGGVQTAGSMISGDQERKASRRARKDLERAQAERKAEIMGIPLPELEAMNEEQYQNFINYQPEEGQAINLGPSALADYQADPDLVRNQRDALAQMSELSEGGLTEGDKLALEESQLSASAGDRGRQEAILQAMSRRGQLGSGGELAARLQSAQGASDNAASANRDAVRGAQQRALAAIAQRGSMASGMRGQGFNEQSGVADRADAISRFNVANRQRISDAGVDTRNSAQRINLQAAQAVGNANRDVRTRNQGEGDRIAQQNYDNEMRRQGIISGVSTAPAEMARQDATANRKATMSGIKGIMDTGVAAYGASNQNEDPSGRTKQGEPIYG